MIFGRVARAFVRLTRGPLLLSLAAAASLSCSILGIGVSEERAPAVHADMPIWLRPAAEELRGKQREDVAARAEQTLVDVALRSETVRKLVERAMPAVVSIYTKTATPYRLSLLPIQLPGFSFRIPLPGEALGSGFFIHPSGYLLSNDHVIANAVTIRARTADGEDYQLEVVARDPVLDIALLRVRDASRGFPHIPLGDSTQVGVGDAVLAIGNPLGLGHSVSQGIISQTGRELVKLEEPNGRQIEFLQTDTAINPGSSGGPLITLAGSAIGSHTAIARSAQGIALALPRSPGPASRSRWGPSWACTRRPPGAG